MVSTLVTVSSDAGSNSDRIIQVGPEPRLVPVTKKASDKVSDWPLWPVRYRYLTGILMHLLWQYVMHLL